MPVPDPSSAAVATKDLLGWGVTGIGLLANLTWNYLNRRYTDRTARSLRQSNFAMDEWKVSRTAINSKLADFEGAGDRLLALVRGDHEAPALRDEISKEGRALVSAHENLLRALARGGDSSWHRYGYGEVTGGESDWDSLNTILGDIASLGDDANAIRYALSTIRPRLDGIALSVFGQLRVHTAELQPDKL